MLTKYWKLDMALLEQIDKVGARMSQQSQFAAENVNLSGKKEWIESIGYIGEQQTYLIQAAEMLREGKLVAFPTETVYGLGADARSTAAVERIFEAKGRPSDNPLIVHIASLAQLSPLVTGISPLEEQLMGRFWPGPLTLVLPAREGAVSSRVTAGLSTVAVRMPRHALALQLIAAAGCPVAAPSANRSGRPSPTLAQHVRDDLDGRIDAIVDGGPTGVGLESTVVEVVDGRVHVLRPGGVSVAELREVAGDVVLDASLLSSGDAGFGAAQAEAAPAGSAAAAAAAQAAPAPKSPGMKYRHYAPTGHMLVVQPGAALSLDAAAARIQAELNAAKARGETTGMLTYAEHAQYYQADVVISIGSLADLASAAQELYAALRSFDEQRVTYILAEACPTDGIGLAVMNRLDKAAGHRVLRF